MAINAGAPGKIKGSSITSPTPSGENHTLVLGQLKETTEVAQRLRGDPGDSFVRVSELVSALGARLVNKTVQPPLPGNAALITVADSITGSGTLPLPLKLVGDQAAPGNSMLYGTNGTGVRGWYAQPVTPTALTVTDGIHSITPTTVISFVGAVVSGGSPTAIVTITASSATKGPPGPAGEDGADGEPGPPGKAGAAGAAGTTGSQGPAGPAIFLLGEDGIDGDPGPPGKAGVAGTTGAQGPTGPAIFLLGEDGIDGDPGPPGNPGTPGANGTTGAQGPAGPALFLLGEDGIDGDPGPPGKAGVAGTTGAQGPTGPAIFLLGEDGIDGDPGPPGNPGSTGPTGALGPQGPMGPAVFLEGEAGNDGDPGPPGAQGIQGPTGPQGPAGPAGSGSSGFEILYQEITAEDPWLAAPPGVMLYPPSALVGLTAIPGGAPSALRSDAAPALSQAIAPTWTAKHTFNGAVTFTATLAANTAVSSIDVDVQGANSPRIRWTASAAAADTKFWEALVNSAGTFALRIVNDAYTVSSNGIVITRTGTAFTNFALGNATDNPTYSFLGTGAATFTGDVTVGAAARTGAVSLIASNTSIVDGDTARVVVSTGSSNVSLFMTDAAQSTAIVTGGPTGLQAVLRTLGAAPIVFGTTNIYRGKIDSTGQWLIAAPTSGASLDVTSLASTPALTFAAASGAYVAPATGRGVLYHDGSGNITTIASNHPSGNTNMHLNTCAAGVDKTVITLKETGAVQIPTSPMVSTVTQAATGLANKLTAATTRNSATLSNEAGMTVTVNETGWYRVEIWIATFEATSGAGGFQFNHNAGTATIANATFGNSGVGGGTFSTTGLTSIATSTAIATVSTSSAAPSWLVEAGTIQVTVAGTFGIQWAQAALLAIDPTTLMAGSHIVLTKIG